MQSPLYMSESFHTVIKEIMEFKESNTLTVSCSFMLENGETIDFTPGVISRFEVEQNFYGAIADTVTIDIAMTTATYMKVVEFRQNIIAKIDIVQSSPAGKSRKDYFKSLRYNAILLNYEDPSFHAPIKSLEHVESEESSEFKTFTVEFDLIPMSIYKVKKNKFNFILNKATMEDTILMIADILGFKEIYLVPPDNTVEYLNVVIPPLLEMQDIFDFLQDSDAYGIYDNGVSYYIYNDILYIYPMFNNLTNTPGFNVYSVGVGSYAGSTNFFKLDPNGDLYVMNNNKLNISTPSQANVENIGTSMIVNTPHKHIDGSGKLTADGLFTVDPEFITSVSIESDPSGVMGESFTQTYETTDNLNAMHTVLSGNLYKTIGFIWPFALPFMVLPTSNVKFVYEDGSHIQTLVGWCTYAKYSFAKTQSINKDTFACKADIVLGLLTD
jgi:hypothetical protein